MKKEELEERIKNGERFFVIYSNDLRQVFVNLDDHDEENTKCIPHLEIKKYSKPFNSPKPFPILIEYTNNEFKVLKTNDKLNILESEEETFIDTIQIEKTLDISIAFAYVKQALKLLKENPLAIEIAKIKPLENLNTWEKEEILNNNILSKRQRELIEEKKQFLIRSYKIIYDDYRNIIKNGHQRIREKYRAAIESELYEKRIQQNFSKLIEELYSSKPKTKTLKRSI